MSAQQVTNLEWLNHNAMRRYPLADDANMTSIEGVLELPTALLLGMTLTIPADFSGDPGRFYLSQVTRTATSLDLRISHDGEVVASASVSLAQHESGKSYSLLGVGSLAEAIGYVTVGDTRALDGSPAGSFSFSEASGRLAMDVIRYNAKQLLSVIVDDGDTQSDPIVDTLHLRAGSGARFRVEDREDGTHVYWDATGDDFKSDCECEPVENRPVLLVNGLPPGADGGVSIFGSRCQRVDAVANGIQLQNPCSEPCCSCEEDAGFLSRMELLASQVSNFGSRIAQLEGAIASLGTSAAASSGDCEAEE